MSAGGGTALGWQYPYLYRVPLLTHPGVAVPVLGAALCVLRAPAHVVDVLGPVGEGGAAAVAGAWRHEAV